MSGAGAELTAEIAARVESFVREVILPYEQDSRRDHHGAPTDELVDEMRDKARAAGLMTPHVLPDGGHMTQRETAIVLQKSGLSPFGALALNTNAPDEGNMYLLGKVGSPELKEQFLKPMLHLGVIQPFRAAAEPMTLQARDHPLQPRDLGQSGVHDQLQGGRIVRQGRRADEHARTLNPHPESGQMTPA